MLQNFYIGQINLWASNNVPAGWHVCDGTWLKSNEYGALYGLLSHGFGGDDEHFALPDFSKKAPKGYHYIIALEGIFPNAAK